MWLTRSYDDIGWKKANEVYDDGDKSNLLVRDDFIGSSEEKRSKLNIIKNDNQRQYIISATNRITKRQEKVFFQAKRNFLTVKISGTVYHCSNVANEICHTDIDNR